MMKGQKERGKKEKNKKKKVGRVRGKEETGPELKKE